MAAVVWVVSEGPRMGTFRGRAFQAEEIATAKVLKQAYWARTQRKPVRLEFSGQAGIGAA